MSALLDAALGYARDGWRVVPMHEVTDGRCSCPKGAECPTPGKHPRLREWQKVASRDEGTLGGWWSHWPNAGPGLVTGGGRGVLDVDPRSMGDAALAELEGFHGQIPRTSIVATGGGGRHYYLAVPEGTRSRDLARGLELKAEGRLVVAPPAVHASGRAYEWVERNGYAPAPEWLLREAHARRNGSAPEVGDVIAEGERNTKLTSFAGSMRRRGMSEEEIAAALLVRNERCCTTPLDEAEVRGIAASVARYEPAAEASAPTVIDEDERAVGALDYVRTKLKLPELRRVIKRSKRDALFDLELADGTVITIGPISAMRDPGKVGDAIADVTGAFPPHYRPGPFRPIANALLKIAELEDTGTTSESVTRAWLRSLIEPYGSSLQAVDMADVDRRHKAVERPAHDVFRDMEGRTYVYLHRLEGHVRNALRVPTTTRDLSARLARLGFENVQVEGRRGDDGKVPKVRYWRSPLGFDLLEDE